MKQRRALTEKSTGYCLYVTLLLSDINYGLFRINSVTQREAKKQQTTILFKKHSLTLISCPLFVSVFINSFYTVNRRHV